MKSSDQDRSEWLTAGNCETCKRYQRNGIYRCNDDDVKWNGCKHERLCWICEEPAVSIGEDPSILKKETV